MFFNIIIFYNFRKPFFICFIKQFVQISKINCCKDVKTTQSSIICLSLSCKWEFNFTNQFIILISGGLFNILYLYQWSCVGYWFLLCLYVCLFYRHSLLLMPPKCCNEVISQCSGLSSKTCFQAGLWCTVGLYLLLIDFISWF